MKFFFIHSNIKKKKQKIKTLFNVLQLFVIQHMSKKNACLKKENKGKEKTEVLYTFCMWYVMEEKSSQQNII